MSTLEELEAIRARHWVAGQYVALALDAGQKAHTDRATLLGLLDNNWNRAVLGLAAVVPEAPGAEEVAPLFQSMDGLAYALRNHVEEMTSTAATAMTMEDWNRVSNDILRASYAVADYAVLSATYHAAVKAETDRLSAELAEIRETLTFYAEKANYNDRPLGNDMWATAAAVFDGGKRARAALAKDATT